jgi:peptidoglycan/xylan/chitin deacetylase (PgdA/CDA1 family)
MLFLSPFLKNVVYPMLSAVGYLRRCAHGPLCIVTYHGVWPTGYVSTDRLLDGSLVSLENFRAQLRLLKTHYHVISPEYFRACLREDKSLPELSILLTCDDGLQNVLSDMLPILQQEGLRCLFFVTGASAGDIPGMLWYEELYLLLKSAPPGPISIDDAGVEAICERDAERRKFWWQLVAGLSERDRQTRDSLLCALRTKWSGQESLEEKLRHNEPTFRRFFLLTAADLRELAAEGMAIGAHTLHHPLLTKVPDTCVETEISGSRALLESVVEREIWAFAYPFGNPGSFSARETKIAEKSFTCAFANFAGGFGAELPRFALPRLHVTADMNLAEFEAHVSGLYRRLRARMMAGARK